MNSLLVGLKNHQPTLHHLPPMPTQTPIWQLGCPPCRLVDRSDQCQGWMAGPERRPGLRWQRDLQRRRSSVGPFRAAGLATTFPMPHGAPKFWPQRWVCLSSVSLTDLVSPVRCRLGASLSLRFQWLRGFCIPRPIPTCSLIRGRPRNVSRTLKNRMIAESHEH